MRHLFKEDQSAPLLPGWDLKCKRYLAILIWLQCLSRLDFGSFILKNIHDVAGKHAR